MNDQRLSRIRIVVIEPALPGNVGSIARAMANFGFENLVLVSPLVFNMNVAASFACNGEYILSAMKTVSSFDDAVAGAQVVIGMTRRAKDSEPTVPVEHAAAIALHAASSADVAIVFGRERSGLAKEEKEKCTVLSHIDSVPGAAGSLNIAHAALLTMHEIFRKPSAIRTGHAAENESLFLSFERFCTEHPAGDPDGMIQNLFRSVITRAMLNETEVKKLKGFFEKCRRSEK